MCLKVQMFVFKSKDKKKFKNLTNSDKHKTPTSIQQKLKSKIHLKEKLEILSNVIYKMLEKDGLT